MKKHDNFRDSLQALKKVKFHLAAEDEIYRMGIVGQFNLTFELAWKSLQATLQMHAVLGAQTGSPRDILRLGFQAGFLDDPNVWLLMLKKRNVSIHVYKEEEIDE